MNYESSAELWLLQNEFINRFRPTETTVEVVNVYSGGRQGLAPGSKDTTCLTRNFTDSNMQQGLWFLGYGYLGTYI